MRKHVFLNTHMTVWLNEDLLKGHYGIFKLHENYLTLPIMAL